MFVFKKSYDVIDIIDWTDFGKPGPDTYLSTKYAAVGLESILTDVRGILNDDIIINGKPDPMIFDSLVDFGG